MYLSRIRCQQPRIPRLASARALSGSKHHRHLPAQTQKQRLLHKSLARHPIQSEAGEQKPVSIGRAIRKAFSWGGGRRGRGFFSGKKANVEPVNEMSVEVIDPVQAGPGRQPSSSTVACKIFKLTPNCHQNRDITMTHAIPPCVTGGNREHPRTGGWRVFLRVLDHSHCCRHVDLHLGPSL